MDVRLNSTNPTCCIYNGSTAFFARLQRHAGESNGHFGRQFERGSLGKNQQSVLSPALVC